MTNPWPLRVFNLFKRLRDKAFSILIGRSFLSFGPKSVVVLPVRLANTDRIAIGTGVHIGESSWLQALDDAPPARAALVIEDGVTVSGLLHASASGSVTIGESSVLGRNVQISDHGHRFDGTGPVVEQGVTETRPTSIGAGCWIGNNVVITAGVTIGRGSVVGANSVVTTDLPDRCVAAGSPARVLRTLTDDV